MMQVQLQIKNDKRVEHFILDLFKKVQKEIMDESSSFLKDVRKSAKLRAPKFSGFLASSIFVKKKGDKQVGLEVDADYAYEQETGEGLPREVPLSELKKAGWTHEASRTRSGLRKTGGGKARAGFFMKRSYKPFIKPALEKNLNKLAGRMNKATKRAITGGK